MDAKFFIYRDTAWNLNQIVAVSPGKLLTTVQPEPFEIDETEYQYLWALIQGFRG